MKAYSTFLLIFILFSCEKVDVTKIDNLNNGKIDVIGHAGAGFQSIFNPSPSNSFTSLKKAIDALNADGSEIDFKVSIDSVPVLFHDNLLEMGSNCIGCPENYLAEDLIKCKFKNYYGSMAGDDEHLITFQRLIEHFKGRSKLPFIYASPKRPTVCTEDPMYSDKYAKVVTRLIKDNNAHSWIFVYDSDVEALNKIKAMDPSVNLIYNGYDFETSLQICIDNNFSGMVIEYNLVTKEQVKKAHLNNKKVTLWGMLLKKEIIDAIEKHPDALMTDNIQLTQEILRR